MPDDAAAAVADFRDAYGQAMHRAARILWRAPRMSVYVIRQQVRDALRGDGSSQTPELVELRRLSHRMGVTLDVAKRRADRRDIIEAAQAMKDMAQKEFMLDIPTHGAGIGV